MPIVHSLRCLFIHVPKTGGSSICQLLRDAAGPPPDYDLSGRAEHPLAPDVRPWDFDMDRRQPLAHHWSAEAVRLAVGDERFGSYFKFAVVRNPWDRLVSYFEYGRQRGSAAETNASSFDAWAKERKLVPRLLPYIRGADGRSAMDQIIRFEHFARDTQQAFRHIGVDLDPGAIPHLKKTTRTDYRDYYSPELIEMVYEHARDDIEAFGYTFDG